MRPYLPSGTVTFVFTDIAGSTKLLNELGDHRYARELAEHRETLRAAFVRYDGAEVDTQGDAFFIAFPTADRAIEAVSDGIRALERGRIRIRAGIHTGAPLLTTEGYVGTDVHRASRIANAGHGGQVLVSATTAALVDTDRFELVDLGYHRLKDLTRPERIFQLGSNQFPPIRSLSPSNLPVPATPFLGRRNELDRVTTLLGEPDVRVVTLTGPAAPGRLG
jgi:class 3 adenylate cyclase